MSIITVTEGFFPVKKRIFSVTGIKEQLAFQYNFPVNERIILFKENKIPATRNFLFSQEKSLNGLKKTLGFDLDCPLSEQDRGHQSIEPLAAYF